MSWLLLVISAHILSAVVFVADKYILAREVKSPIVYAFYNGILSIFVFCLLPWGNSLPELWMIIPAIMSGMFFTIALIFFYSAIEKNPTSRIIPFMGTIIPIFTFFLSHIFLAEQLNRNQFIAFYLLILGGILVTAEHKKRTIFSKKGISYGLFAALAFSISFILMKYTYNHAPFISGFIWTRVGSVLLSIIIFLIPFYRHKISETSRHTGIKTSVGYLVIRIVSAVSFIMLNYAIAISSVTLVNALQGIQYVFLIIIAIFLSKKIPQFFAEEFQTQIIQRIIAVSLITFGLAILAFK